jgi:acyl-coenzyme A thioesterase PaaI-like protein
MSAADINEFLSLAGRSETAQQVSRTDLAIPIITMETGTIRVEERTLCFGRRAATAEGKITDADGRLLAHGTSTCLVFDIPKAADAGTRAAERG